MEILTKNLDGKPLVILVGSLDSLTALEASYTLCELIPRGEQNMTIDLSQVDFISSAGLCVLLTVWKAIHAQGGDLILIGAKPGVENLLEITGFTSFLKVFPTWEAAQASPATAPVKKTSVHKPRL